MSFLCHSVSETGIDTVSENLLSGVSVKYGKRGEVHFLQPAEGAKVLLGLHSISE